MRFYIQCVKKFPFYFRDLNNLPLSLPVRVFLDHLVNVQEKGFVADGRTHTLLIETELCRGDGLTVRDQREIELKLLVVTPLRRELSVVLHCGMDTQKQTGE